MLVDVPLAKASHVAMPRVNVGEDYLISWIYAAIIATIYRNFFSLVSLNGNTLHLSVQVAQNSFFNPLC